MQIYKTPLREFKFLIEDFLNLKESQTLKKLDLETSSIAYNRRSCKTMRRNLTAT
jgi:hypothetical protein